MPSILLRGHHGLGDCLHQRAIVRQLLAAGNDVWIETPWPSVYYDLNVRTVRKPSALRTQAKNIDREADLFSAEPVPADARTIQLRYSGDGVRRAGSVLAAMSCPGFDSSVADFRLPVPDEWKEAALYGLFEIGFDATKPLMLYRPLVERTEYASSALRNPDHAAYIELFKSIRSKYFVVSVADLEPGKEWIVGERVCADAKFHNGELDFTALAGLAAVSDLVFCAPGFATVLAQAVETPCVTVFGGYECGSSFSVGARHSPYLAIEPVQPCECFNGACDRKCSKEIDMSAALSRLEAFCG
jgi:ADP-heptose:LPS heptosyltransferase